MLVLCEWLLFFSLHLKRCGLFSYLKDYMGTAASCIRPRSADHSFSLAGTRIPFLTHRLDFQTAPDPRSLWSEHCRQYPGYKTSQSSIERDRWATVEACVLALDLWRLWLAACSYPQIWDNDQNLHYCPGASKSHQCSHRVQDSSFLPRPVSTGIPNAGGQSR